MPNSASPLNPREPLGGSSRQTGVVEPVEPDQPVESGVATPWGAPVPFGGPRTTLAADGVFGHGNSSVATTMRGLGSTWAVVDPDDSVLAVGLASPRSVQLHGTGGVAEPPPPPSANGLGQLETSAILAGIGSASLVVADPWMGAGEWVVRPAAIAFGDGVVMNHLFSPQFIVDMVGGVASTSTTPLRVGDFGMPIDVLVRRDGTPVDLSSASLARFIFQKSDGRVLVRDAAFHTDGRDGILHHRLEVGDVDVAGKWRFQLLLHIGGEVKRSEVIKFGVGDVIETEG